jgi:cobalt-zinc-cadmium resistance protein CzcA
MNKIVIFALRNRGLMLLAMAALFAAGVVSFIRLNIEAYPDPVPPLVEVVTQNTGQSAEEIERYITIPIEIQLAGIPHVTSVRTISLFGLSDVKVQFSYDFSYDEAEQRVINRLTQLSPLPNGAQPQISPESPIGEIYRYRVVGPPGYSVTDLKTLQDWVLERRFKAVPGVIDVTGWGGKTKTYDVNIDKSKLVAYGVSLTQVLAALNNGNGNVGGQTLNIGPQAAIVRGVGLIHSLDQVRDTMIAAPNGSPVLIGDVAKVEIGHLPRLGIAGQDDDDDIVQGIVLMHRGEKSMPTIRAVEAEVQKINSAGVLPPGVHVEKIYDRSDLIAVTTHTVLHNMLMGVILIFLVQWLFLGNLRSALIVAATIPFALFFAILIMTLRGESANLLSVGAIDFGLVVDATVILVENVYRRLAEEVPHAPLTPRQAAQSRLAAIADAASQVNRAIFFSAAIIIASFVPLFTMTGVEGHIFGPMARTYAYAIAGGLVATFTISPALSALLLPKTLSEVETFLVRALRRIYTPAVGFALRRRGLTLGGLGVLALLTVLAAGSLGTEFLPHLEEGNFWIRATLPQSISLEEGDRYVNQMRALMRQYPEVVTVVSQHGRPDDGTDATGFFNAEFFVPLKPFGQWPHGVDKAGLTARMSKALTDRFPGVDFNFSQNIEDNVEEAASGVKGENSVKLFGADLQTLENTAGKIKDAMSHVPGITDLEVLSSLGQPTVQVDVDRAKAARFGLQVGDINTAIATAIGGQQAGSVYEAGSDRNFAIMVRLQPSDRHGLDALRSLLISAPATNGGTMPVQVPLTEVANVRLVSGAAFVYRENQERYIPIKFSVRGRDLGSAVQDAQARVAREVALPGGYRMEWVGELGQLKEAVSRLEVAVPISLALIALLLFINFSSVTDMLLAISVMPMAMIGGIFALALTHTALSVSATIGFIGLFGISVMNGIIVLSSFNRLVMDGRDRRTAILQACETQLRPVVMTCVAACVGLLPAALSNGIGSQVQKPLALVVVGGILLAPILILIVLPVLIDMFSTRGRRRRGADADDVLEGEPKGGAI